MSLDEHALCIPREVLPAEWLGSVTALPLEKAALTAGLLSEKCQFRCRREIEDDFSLKQIIPYVIVFNREGELLAYRRHGTETRLHRLWSVGVGGHVNQSDGTRGMSAIQYIENGMKRECAEELETECTDFKLLGIINEEETDVGHVHLGIVFSTRLPEASAPCSDELGEVQFVSIPAAMALQTELWSRLALKLIKP